LAFLLAGCASPATPPAPPATAGTAALAGPEGLKIALLWEAAIDLDLYVTDPAQETVYFANTPARSGGRLEKDAGCSAPPGTVRLERTVWAAPTPGRYRVGVDFMKSCDGRTGRAGFRVLADVRGQKIEKRGTALGDRFEPIVLEIDVP
jgi:hypothetical protein